LNNIVLKKKSKLYHILTKNRNKNGSFPQASTNTKILLQWVNPKLFLLHQKGNDEHSSTISSEMEEQQTWRMTEEENYGHGGRRKLEG